MSILDKLGEVAGAVAAVEGVEKLDPDAGLLTKAAAAVAGFEGAGALEELVEKKEKKEDDETEQPSADASDDSAAQS